MIDRRPIYKHIRVYSGYIYSATLLILLLQILLVIGCNNVGNKQEAASGEELKLKYAQLLNIETHPAYTDVTIRNPWDTLKVLQRYILVPKDSLLPPDLPSGILLRTPVSNALVYSTVHTALLGELGAYESIGGICDAEFTNDSLVTRRLRNGAIADCGNSQNPNTEKVIALNPDLAMLSPYENGSHNSKISQLGIPILECADYMEPTPLGRAEWMRLYGLLFGVSDKADEVFGNVESTYLSLRQKASEVKQKPKVLTDQRYGQVWNVPTRNSTLGQLIEDAGGINPFASYRQNGSVALSPEKVLSEAHDADVWFIRYYQKGEKNLKQLAADAPVNSQFKAFKTGRVYGCNTTEATLFEDTPFHPELFLQDLVILMHPGLIENQKPAYFHKLKPAE